MKIKKFLGLLLLFIYIKPHFYYYSYSVARITDLLGIFILLLVILFYVKEIKIYKDIQKYFLLSFLFFVNIILSLFYASFVQNVVFQDFIDLIRPITFIIAILFGFTLYKNNFKREEITSFFITLGLICSIVVFLEKAGLSIFYEIYSDFNHKSTNRATGIYYDFAELGALQSLAIVSSFIKFIESKQKKQIIYILIFSVSIILSTSKASILLLGIVYLCLGSHVINKPKHMIYFLLSLSLFSYLAYLFLEKYDEALIKGLIDVFTLSEGHASVGNRLENIDYVINLIKKFDLRSFIGYSASRDLEGSYIEVAFFSTLFRYGIIGVIIYYLIFVVILFEKISKPYSYYKYVVLATIALDTVAAMTNRFSFPIALFILLGILISERKNNSKT